MNKMCTNAMDESKMLYASGSGGGFSFRFRSCCERTEKKKYERTEKKKYEIISNYFGAKLNVTNGNICYIAELNPEEQSLNKPDYNLSLISCVISGATNFIQTHNTTFDNHNISWYFHTECLEQFFCTFKQNGG